MSGGAFLESDSKSMSVAARQSTDKQRRRSSSGSIAAGIHGRGRNSIGSVSAVLYKSFRERFMSSAKGGGSGSGSDAGGNYRVLRQRDLETGRMNNESSSNESSSVSELSELSSSSVEDLFANETDRRNWRQKRTDRRPRSRRRAGRNRRKMGRRTGASSSCEDLILEISLPDEPMAADKMTLTLHEKELDLGTTLYRLKLPLPHSVDVDRCHAKYDSELGKLRLTLRLRRELDYVNF